MYEPDEAGAEVEAAGGDMEKSNSANKLAEAGRGEVTVEKQDDRPVVRSSGRGFGATETSGESNGDAGLEGEDDEEDGIEGRRAWSLSKEDKHSLDRRRIRRVLMN